MRHGTILLIIQALAFAVLEVIINDGPDSEIFFRATLGAVKAEICDVDVAGDEEGVGASNESGSGGEDCEEMHLDGAEGEVMRKRRSEGQDEGL